MGLDIVAYSHLRFRAAHAAEDDSDLELEAELDEDDVVHVYRGDFDRLDGLPEGLYEPTTEIHVWWHAEHGTHAIPASEIAATQARIEQLRAGKQRAECPGDLAVLASPLPVTERTSFRAGSYSGYNWWREQLCRFALEVEPGEVWEDPDAFAGKAFVELINFSDAEGAIGPRTAAKLARDFQNHAARRGEWAARHIANADEREYFVESYADWQHGFELAAQGGVLIFC